MKRKINYKVLKGGDLFFSSADNPIGNLIRWNEAGFGRRRDLSIPNHAGIITEAYGQFFATEMGPFGLSENSMDKYRKKRNKIVGVYRWNRFNTEIVRYRAQKILAEQRRKKVAYSWFGAIKSIPLWRKIFKWVKVKEEVDFCSENAFYLLRECGLTGYQEEWDNNPPHPLDLYHFVKKRSDFEEIEPIYIS